MMLGQPLRGRRVGVVLSAGGLVAAFAAAGLPAARIAESVVAQRREHFWDPDYLGIAVDAVRRGHRPSGLLQGARFCKLLEASLPVPDFAGLATPLVLVGPSLSKRRPHVMTQGPLASAIHATCAYPGLFQAVRRDGVLLWDGGLVDKAPALALKDSEVGAALDVLLVHSLASRDGPQEPAGALAYPQGISAGFAAVRRDHFRFQLEVLKARGVEVHVVTSQLPPVTPKTMHLGSRAVAAGRRAALVSPRMSAPFTSRLRRSGGERP
jgi:NTE family protein